MGELRMMSFSFPPKGWSLCNGAFLPINQNQALFSLLGTTYGGDGRTSFALPNLQGRVPLHPGQGFTLGQVHGEVNHTLAQSELPSHTHTAAASTVTGNGIQLPESNYLGGGGNVYHPASGALTPLRGEAVKVAGGSQPLSNQQPYLAVNFCIAIQGIFPSRN
jgi:microcystin-dependent protein